MNILIIGCGKVGSRLATNLAREGHEVSVVASNEASFDALDESDGIYTTAGVPIDQDVLRSAGIENCDAVAAVSENDNMNIMVSQVAREIFGIEQVIARVYDPRREDVFSHFGLKTVCPTNLTVSSVKNALMEPYKTNTVHFGPNTVSFITVNVPGRLVGESASNLDFEDDQSLHAVLRSGQHMILYKGQELRLQETDKLIIAQIVD